MTDEDLIRKIAAKDPAAFKTLMERYQSLVANTCWNLLRRKEDAEDVAQEVFLQVYRTAESFRLESKLSTWLYRIAVNRSLNFLRDNRWFRLLKSLSLDWEDEGYREIDVPTSSDSPDKELEQKESTLAVREAILSLPEKQRAAFVLHKYEGLSYKEAAQVLGCSIASVESLIHRAKLNLQKQLLRYLEKK